LLRTLVGEIGSDVLLIESYNIHQHCPNVAMHANDKQNMVDVKELKVAKQYSDRKDANRSNALLHFVKVIFV